ncbi:MAG TPA: K(+)-transporting ATPase subunit C [Ignavibacteria bacterium]|nr:K(+)-transporting ATPase subunit C [Ignavibacteria bacterium]
MFKHLKQSLILTIFCILIFGALFPMLIVGIGKIFPNQSSGLPLYKNGEIIGYENIGQSFNKDKYFWGRPSAVDYNAAGSGASNKGPSNPEYLTLVQERIDTFLVHNPGINKSDIPSELVTASGSGLDPHITPQGAYVQVKRVSAARNISEDKVKQIVQSNIEKPALGFIGQERVNVLKLNLALDELR